MADTHRTCCECGEQFALPSGRGRKPIYCSDDCRSRGRAEQTRQAAKAKNAQSSRKKKEAWHMCQWCGSQWQGRKHKFCSHLCSVRSRSKTGRSREEIKAEADARKTRQCHGCGKTYIKKRKHKHQGNKYCSRDCYYTALKQTGKGPACSVDFASCVECGSSFARSSTAKLCSDACRKRYVSRKARELAEQEHKGVAQTDCLCCGVTFCRLYGEKSKLCSDQCRDALRKAAKRKRGNTHKRRARYFGVCWEPVDPLAVFSRDGWRCQMCNTKTPKRLRGTLSKKAPELDHIVPMSKGGPHTYKNTQCLCRSCNSAKSDQVIGQLRLVG